MLFFVADHPFIFFPLVIAVYWLLPKVLGYLVRLWGVR